MEPGEEVLISRNYNPDCTHCWLHSGHTWVQHYASLLRRHLEHQANGRQWSEWSREERRELAQLEQPWWEENAPFPWLERYSIMWGYD